MGAGTSFLFLIMCFAFMVVFKIYERRHIIDWSPSPMHIGLACIKAGISYFAFCGTEEQRVYLEEQLLADLKREVQDPASTLCNTR